jgi:hypothetical protein
LLADGNCVYQGEAVESAKYFRKLGFNLPHFSNPADHFMRILFVHHPKSDKEVRKLDFFKE